MLPIVHGTLVEFYQPGTARTTVQIGDYRVELRTRYWIGLDLLQCQYINVKPCNNASEPMQIGSLLGRGRMPSNAVGKPPDIPSCQASPAGLAQGTCSA